MKYIPWCINAEIIFIPYFFTANALCIKKCLVAIELFFSLFIFYQAPVFDLYISFLQYFGGFNGGDSEISEDEVYIGAIGLIIMDFKGVRKIVHLLITDRLTTEK